MTFLLENPGRDKSSSNGDTQRNDGGAAKKSSQDLSLLGDGIHEHRPSDRGPTGILLGEGNGVVNSITTTTPLRFIKEPCKSNNEGGKVGAWNSPRGKSGEGNKRKFMQTDVGVCRDQLI